MYNNKYIHILISDFTLIMYVKIFSFLDSNSFIFCLEATRANSNIIKLLNYRLYVCFLMNLQQIFRWYGILVASEFHMEIILNWVRFINSFLFLNFHNYIQSSAVIPEHDYQLSLISLV